MNDKDQELELRELRNHIRTCLIERINQIITLGSRRSRYYIQLKTWCITLFIATVGFALQIKDYQNLILVFSGVLVFMFWFNHAYKEYLSKQNNEKEIIINFNIVLSKLYEYSYPELIKIENKYLRMGIAKKTENEYKFIGTRLRKKKEVLKIMFIQLENLAFFGVMVILWLIIIIIKIVE
jgi:hypothetical protein